MLEPHQQRMIDEADTFKLKIQSLIIFIQQNPIYKGLESMDQSLLDFQLQAMQTYLRVLLLRIERATK